MCWLPILDDTDTDALEYISEGDTITDWNHDSIDVFVAQDDRYWF